eukprot:365460-Chlamydomonas_euryale.AAC.8
MKRAGHVSWDGWIKKGRHVMAFDADEAQASQPCQQRGRPVAATRCLHAPALPRAPRAAPPWPRPIALPGNARACVRARARVHPMPPTGGVSKS